MRSKHTEFGGPEVSKDALVYSFKDHWGGPKLRAVYVDQASRMIHFYNCHRPRKFLPVSEDEWFSCSVDELQRAFDVTIPLKVDSPPAMHVHTPSGIAIIIGRHAGYKEIRDIIQEFAPKSTPESETKAAMVSGIIIGALVGWYAGWKLLPLTPAGTFVGDDGTLIQYTMGGIVLGAASGFLLAWFVGRLRED
jgi:hypothetical protein